jgi:hypothetical protein
MKCAGQAKFAGIGIGGDIMKAIRYLLIVLWALYSVPSYADQMNMSIGIDLQEYPELVLVPDSPVYYAPQLEANYFFYDGEYWVYQNDTWYESSWYDGPWWQVNPEDVPDFVLRVPVRFYLMAPTFFISWWSEEPPHWGEHWGHDWEQHRRGWDKWDHHVHPLPAPLPLYQRQYKGDRYPRHVDQQHELQRKHYNFQPHDPIVQRRHPETLMPVAPIQREKVRSHEEKTPLQQGTERPVPHQQGNSTAPNATSPQRGGAIEPGRTPYAPQQKQPALIEHRPQPQPQAQPQPNPAQHEQKVQRSQDRETIQQDSETRRQGNETRQQGNETRQQGNETRQQGNETRQQGNDAARESNRGQEQDKERGRDR